MRKIISIILILAISLQLVACKQVISPNDYAYTYREGMLKLNKDMKNTFDLVASDLLNTLMFDNVFSINTLNNELGKLNSSIDDVLFELQRSALNMEDERILRIQSDIELSLETMNIELEKYLEDPALASIHPSRINLYEASYNFISNISIEFDHLFYNLDLMEVYLNDYCENGFFHELHRERYDNNIKLSYLYNFLGIGIAAAKEYTGLHVNYRMPIYIQLGETYMTYEFSLGILESLIMDNERVGNRLDVLDMKVLENDEDLKDDLMIRDTLELLTQNYEDYFVLRSQYPVNFYVSEDFINYQSGQHIKINNNITYVFEFDEKYPELLLMKENFMDLIGMSFDEDLRNYIYKR